MIFKQEAGAIITQHDRPLTFIDGTPGEVKFPAEFIWEVHQKSPGLLYKLAHTHPPGMKKLSKMDIETMKGWAWALHPYPISMSTVTLDKGHIFTESTFMTFLEPKEFWLHRGKGPRKLDIIQMNEFGFSAHWLHFNGPKWLQKLVLRSYEFEPKEDEEEYV